MDLDRSEKQKYKTSIKYQEFIYVFWGGVKRIMNKVVSIERRRIVWNHTHMMHPMGFDSNFIW